MRRYLGLSALVLVVAIIAVRNATADQSTPFIEGKNDVGDVAEGNGYVLAGQSDDGPSFLVLVHSDTLVWSTILAEAEKGVVPASLIGRPVRIKAQVVAKEGKPRDGFVTGMRLKIISVTRQTRAATAATRPAA